VLGLALVGLGFVKPESGLNSGLAKPETWLRLKPGLIHHIWLLLQTASKGIAEDVGVVE